jgi:hypothetical protein
MTLGLAALTVKYLQKRGCSASGASSMLRVFNPGPRPKSYGTGGFARPVRRLVRKAGECSS